MKIIKNRYFLLVLSLTASILIAFAVVPLMAGAYSGTVDVVRVKDRIEAGTMITREMLKIEKVGKLNLPGDIILNPDEIVGKYSRVELLPGDNLVWEKFAGREQLEDAFLYDLAREKKLAMSISVKSFAAGLSGLIKPGDIISVMYFDKNYNPNPYSGESNDGVIYHPLLQNLEVAAVSRSRDGTGYADSITVLVTAEQAKLLVEAENAGNIHILAAGRGGESKRILLKED